MTVPAARLVAAIEAAPDVRVRPASRADLAATAGLHRQRLPRGFFARLGPAFLGRYHASFAASPRAVLLVAEQDGRVAGFLAGTVHNAEHYRFVLRRQPVGLVTSAGAALVRDRDLACEFARTRLRRYARAVLRQARSRATGGSATDDGAVFRGPVAVLTHVAVAEHAAGSGCGRALVGRFVAVAAAAGASEVRLITATDGGGPAFYRRLGWYSRGERRGADGSLVEEFALSL